MSHLPKPGPSTQLFGPLARPVTENRGVPHAAPGRQPSAFDTMETKFFREGDELSQLSTGPDAGDGWAEATASVQWHRRRAGTLSWAAVGMAAVLVSSVLAFRLAGRQPLPSQAVAAEAARPMAEVRTVAAATTATVPVLPEKTISVPAAGASPDPQLPLPSLAPPPQPAAGASISQPRATSAQAEDSALVACQTAFARHRARDVLAKCRRAFALDPASAEIAVMLAKTEFDRGSYRPALDWARQALALDDRQADAYVFLGGAEQAAGHRAAARSAYQRYLALSPKGRYAGDVRAVLGSL